MKTPQEAVQQFLAACSRKDADALSRCLPSNDARLKLLTAEQLDALKKQFGAATVVTPVPQPKATDRNVTVSLSGGDRKDLRVARVIDLGDGLLVTEELRVRDDFAKVQNFGDLESNRGGVEFLLGKNAVLRADAVRPPQLEGSFPADSGGSAFTTDAKNNIRTVLHNIDIGAGRRGWVQVRIAWFDGQPAFGGATADALTMSYLKGSAAVQATARLQPPQGSHPFKWDGGITHLTMDSQGRIESAAANIDLGAGRRGTLSIRIGPDGSYQGILAADHNVMTFLRGSAAIQTAEREAINGLKLRGAEPADPLPPDQQPAATSFSEDRQGRITAVVLWGAKGNSAVGLSPETGKPAPLRWAVVGF